MTVVGRGVDIWLGGSETEGGLLEENRVKGVEAHAGLLPCLKVRYRLMMMVALGEALHQSRV